MLFTVSNEESAVFTGAVGDIVEVEAEFVRYIYENAPFVIASFMDDNYEEFSILGNVPFELKAGRSYRINGEIEEEYNKYRDEIVRQLRLRGIALLPPTGEVGIIRYLQSLKGLKSRAFSLYDTYGEDTLRIMREEPDRVAKEVRGISLKMAEKFQEQLLEQEESSEALTFLLNIGLSLNEADALIRNKGEDVKRMVEKNPYLLTRKGDWPGMSFQRVDKIAMEWGIDPNMPERKSAAVFHVFDQESAFGHCYSDFDSIVSGTIKVLSNKYIGFEREDIEGVVEGLLLRDILYLEEDRLYMKSFYEKEKELAGLILDLATEKPWDRNVNPELTMDAFLNKRQITLEAKQREAVIKSLKNKGDFIILNGAAGTGKTFTADIILRLLIETYEADHPKQKAHVSVVAPTGKAAKVLRQALKYQYLTMTIHRALKAEGNGFFHNENNKLPSNIYVVDETSMLDTHLAHALFSAIPKGSKVILLGDTRQLPAIGAGNVLADTVRSGICPVVTLEVPKRQAKGSSIYENATRILDQEIIQPDKTDTFWFKTNSGSQATNRAVNVVRKIVAYEPEDIQILSPMRAGSSGTHLLNYLFQKEWNNKHSDSSQLNHSFKVGNTMYKLYFRVNDKVMQTVNNATLEWVQKENGHYVADEDLEGTIVTNGEQGWIIDIFEDEVRTPSGRKQKINTIAVQFDEGIVLYRGNEKQDLDHAYAISVHKSQGSQWPVVVQLLDYNSHQRMLSNELLYTGYSRASERHILFADEASVNVATAQRIATKRRTSLVDRIQELH